MFGRQFNCNDDSGWGADWHLESVAFVDPVAKARYEFTYNDWLKDRKEVEIPLTAKTALNADMEVEEKDSTVDLASIALGTYTVTVVTGSDKGASTDANISITIYGDNGDSGVKQLAKSSTNKNKFETDTPPHPKNLRNQHVQNKSMFRRFVFDDQNHPRCSHLVTTFCNPFSNMLISE